MTVVRAPVEKPTVRALSGTFTAAMGGIGPVFPYSDQPALRPRAPVREHTGNRVLSPLFSSGWWAKPISDGRGNRFTGNPLPDVEGLVVNLRLSSGASWPAVDKRQATGAPPKPPGKGANPEPGGRG